MTDIERFEFYWSITLDACINRFELDPDKKQEALRAAMDAYPDWENVLDVSVAALHA